MALHRITEKKYKERKDNTKNCGTHLQHSWHSDYGKITLAQPKHKKHLGLTNIKTKSKWPVGGNVQNIALRM